MDYENLSESVAALCESINEFIRTLGVVVRELLKKIGEMLEKIRCDILKAEWDAETTKPENKPKYKFIKSLIKPYKQPFIKIKAKARANL